jgi:hypothetical protein
MPDHEIGAIIALCKMIVDALNDLIVKLEKLKDRPA